MINKITRRIDRTLRKNGIDLTKLLRPFHLSQKRKFENQLRLLKQQQGQDRSFIFSKNRPIFHEDQHEGGTMKGHYFHQDLLVARRIFNSQPLRHIDIGSRTDGFVAHVACFREIEVLDIRAISSRVKNIHFRQADLMQLPSDLLDCCDSISSLHAIEHFGLGRYGDPIDYFGHIKALENITKMLKNGGVFYFSTPIGPQRIEFNAHRVFSLTYLLDLFQEKFELIQFSFVDETGNLQENIELTEHAIANNCGCNYGCGIFELRKR
jgi:hypothetical protein